MSWDEIINDESLTFDLSNVAMADLDEMVAQWSEEDLANAAAVLGLQDVVDEAERKQRILAALSGGMKILKGFLT